MSGPKTYRKRPVDVEAIQWLGAPTSLVAPSASRIIDWVLSNGGTARFVNAGEDHPLRYPAELYPHSRKRSVANDAPSFLVIETLEGPHRANPGDFIIRGVQGEFYPCKPDIFAETYEEPKQAMVANEHTPEPREPWSPFPPRVRALVSAILASPRVRDAGSIEYRPTNSHDFTKVKLTISADLTWAEIHGVEQTDIAPPRRQRTVGVGSYADSTGMEFVAVETVHLSRGGGVTVCCRRTLFELPRDERTTTDPMAVTCEGP